MGGCRLRIVEPTHATRLPHEADAMGQAREPCEGLANCHPARTGGEGCHRGGQSVETIVRERARQLGYGDQRLALDDQHVVDDTRVAGAEPERHPTGPTHEVAHHGRILSVRDGHTIGVLIGPDPSLRALVSGERGMDVEVIGIEVEPGGDLRSERLRVT